MKKLIQDSGSAMLIAISLIAMLTGVAIMSVDRATTDMDLSSNQFRDERAFYLAEAGIERAIAHLNSDKAWRNGYYKQVLEGGNYTVTVTDKTTNPLLGDSIVLAGTGVFWDGTANLEVWLVKNGRYPYRHAAFGDELLFMQNDACTDSYNSDSGTYSVTQNNSGGDIGSNEEISIKDNVTVGGDLTTATGGTIQVTSPASYTGDTSTTADPQSLDLVSDDDYAYAQANNSAPAGFIGTGYSYSSGNLEIQDNKTLTLNSGTYYFKKLHLKNQAQIQLAPGANVKIFIVGDLLIEDQGKLNITGVPSQCAIFTKGTYVDFKNGSTIKATVYAPNCDFMHQNTSDIYGAVIAKSVEIKNDACIHYDRALYNYSFGVGGDYEKVAWRQLD